MRPIAIFLSFLAAAPAQSKEIDMDAICVGLREGEYVLVGHVAFTKRAGLGCSAVNLDAVFDEMEKRPK